MPQLRIAFGVAVATVGLIGVGGPAVPAVGVGPFGVASALAAPQPGPVDRAVASLQSAQRRDGGFAVRSGATASDPVTSVWAVLGLTAVGIHPADQPRRGTTALTYLTRHADALQDTGDAARLLLILRAAGEADGKAATETAARILERRRDDGAFPAQAGGTPSVTATAFAVLALAGARNDPALRPVLDAATAWLLQVRRGNGWGNLPGGAANAEATGLVLQAIQAIDPEQYEAATAGQSFLAARGNPDGGLSGTQGGRSDARATAWAMQGLYATGVDPRTYETLGGGTPGAYLTKQQQSDGSFGSILRTAQILPGLNGTAFPLKTVSTGNRRANLRATNPQAKTTHAGSGSGGAAALERAQSGSNGTQPDAPAGNGTGTGTAAPSSGSAAAPATAGAVPLPPASSTPAPAAAAPTAATPKTDSPAPTAAAPTNPTVDGVVVGTQGPKAAAPGVAGGGSDGGDRQEILVLGAVALLLFALGSQLERRRPRRVFS